MATFSDGQIDAYLRDNKIYGAAEAAKAGKAFGVDQSRIDASIGRLNLGMFGGANNASFAYNQAVKDRPDLVQQNNDFALKNGLPTQTYAQSQATPTPQQVSATTTVPNATFMGNGGSAAPSMAAYEKNPYLDDMAKGITSQMNENWTRNQLPSIRSGAMAAGGFGGSRQGVVEANGLNDMNRSLGQNLTTLYGQDYTQDRQRALQKYSADQGYNLGMANNNLGYMQANNQNNQANANNALGYANLDSNNAQFGANFGLQSLDAQNRWANNNVNTANTIQNTPINYFNGFNNNANTIAGQGQGMSQTNQADPWASGFGGALTGNKLWGKP